MKNEFRPSLRHIRCYLLVALGAATLVCTLLSRNLLILNVLVPISACMMLFMRRYRISDDGVLTGMREVRVASILKVVVRKDRTDIYIGDRRGGVPKIVPYFPVDREGFAAALKAVNPSIEVIGES